MRDQDGWLATVRGLLGVLGASDVTEFHYQGRDIRVRLLRRPTLDAQAAPVGPAQEPAADLYALTAPLTGVFYTAPSPHAEPYVQEGDWLEPGTVVGLIEAMKVFNEVVADVGGRLVRVHAATGQLVHQGDVLLSVDPRATAPGREAP